MAPRRSLRVQPDCHSRRRTGSDVGSHVDPAVIPNDAPSSSRLTRQSTRLGHFRLIERENGQTVGRIKKSLPTRARTPRLRNRPAPPRVPAKQEKKECFICAAEKDPKFFKMPYQMMVCNHFEDICSACTGKMVKAKITDRRLGESILECPFPQCGYAMHFETVKQMISKAAFQNWDKALTNHHLRSSEAFISCLNAKCGKHFSIDGCQANGRRSSNRQIACPYCDYEICVSCIRPWHENMSCDMNMKADEKKSESTIENLGAKSCPKCTVRIEKNGGCDHMTCNFCGYHFCWQCLAQYSTTMRHGLGCRHGVQGTARDPRNWVHDATLNIHDQLHHVLNAAAARINPNLQLQANAAIVPPQPRLNTVGQFFAGIPGFGAMWRAFGQAGINRN